jgi:NAD(P)-dependent dehydrogenase (short-subunit alcohol dehydrogenase family)
MGRRAEEEAMGSDTTRGGAVVTGAGGGLGKEIARALAGCRYRVHVTDVDAGAAAATAAELGGDTWASHLDVRDEAACRAVAAETAGRAGTLHAWVNNAGILRTGCTWDHPADERRWLFDVNVHGTVNGTLAALEVMCAQRRGTVVNVVSLAGLVAPPGETLYAATKHACLAFSVGAQTDLRRTGFRDVHVCALCPNGIWTPMLEAHLDEPEAAMSWSGSMLEAAGVATKAVQLVQRPRPVVSMPRYRGALARLFAATPRMGAAAAPLYLAAGRRKQRQWREQVRA